MSLDKHPETLGDWRKVAIAAVGEDSPAVEYLDGKIMERGENAKVVKHWTQMLALLKHIHNEG